MPSELPRSAPNAEPAPSLDEPAVFQSKVVEASSPRDLGPHAELLSRVWQQSLPLMRQRVLTLEQAAQTAVTEPLSATARTDAADLAHKLAGSLGMFGYPLGTAIAREMEQLLEAEAPVDALHFRELAARLRSALPL